jgi:hypothetical protein
MILSLFLSFTVLRIMISVILKIDHIIKLRRNCQWSNSKVQYLKSISAGGIQVVPYIIERKLVQTTAVEEDDKNELQDDVAIAIHDNKDGLVDRIPDLIISLDKPNKIEHIRYIRVVGSGSTC